MYKIDFIAKSINVSILEIFYREMETCLSIRIEGN